MRKNIEESYNSQLALDRSEDESRYGEVSVISYYEKVLLPLLTPLEKQFKSGKYAMVLGEDSSARICTLIVGELAKKIAQSSQVHSPEVRFYAGFRTEDKEKSGQLASQLTKWKEELGGEKILYVTESIGEGGSLKNFLVTAHKIGMKADIIIAENFSNDKVDVKALVGEEIYSSTVDSIQVGNYVGSNEPHINQPLVFKDPEKSGTTKNINIARPNKKLPTVLPGGIVSYAYKYNHPDLIKASRVVTKLVAENLFAELNPTLYQLFETMNKTYAEIVAMTDNEKRKYIDWLDHVKMRLDNDPRVKIENVKKGYLVSDSFSILRYYVQAEVRSSYDLESEFNKVMTELKNFFSELESRQI